ncbi:hypothetical protein VXO67_17690 [Acinetobacter baumannii]|uniref:hypothetical protein n=1 Tax=Acinetobacter baumannii TaxID=470 RepID=UPI0038B462CC
MDQDDLKDKIKKAIFGTLGGVLLYLVISFFLLSDYPLHFDHFDHFDHKKTYEVLKDALSIAAAFLAPVAAFILFTDWRYQHSAIKIENTSEAIHKELNELLNILLNSTKILRNDIFNEDLLERELKALDKQFNNISPYIFILEKKRDNLNVDDYMKYLNELINKYLDLNKKISDISSTYQYMRHETDEEALKSMKENIRDKILKDLNEIRNELVDIYSIDMFQLYQKSKNFNL